MKVSGIVTLLTDFGHRDPYAGVMKGVILSLWPQARLVDLTHDVPAQNVAEANFALQGSWPFFPEGTIHVVVVDPAVGSGRRILCVEAHGHVFLGPDNGVLSGLLEQATAIHAVEDRSLYRDPDQVSNTFHGRDIIAPVAARIGTGLPPSRVGPKITDPTVLARPEPTRNDQTLVGSVIHVDAFGNLISNIRTTHLEGKSLSELRVTFRGVDLGAPVASYASVAPGQPLAIVDSFGFLEIAVNSGSAALHFNGSVGDPVRVT